ncbi:tyrocidine synthase 3 [Ruminiclostridium hungatei]|uniref:Tyrocidine synthase 3 n=1 Tax=Ruminiclostridium hungatei TaxID=48256 RepID=A0A1V4SHN8_RUMHU|nr:amino acid adenylation domain-containing protein [Ruminiclostridium hungatei]OPX42985.1 tyrocidine synthase 3 [Ruminiclostridium hungatei]
MQINVLEYLEQAAYKYPDKVALKDETQEITFFGLELEAKALGTMITDKTSGSVRNPVIVFVDRTCSTIVAFMGVLYSGNYYVPIDNQTPPQRLRTIISTLKPRLILCGAKDIRAFEGMADLPEILKTDEIQNKADNEKLQVVRSRLIDTDPVYTIFTSGSTGTPKGIVVPHRNVMDLAEWLDDTFGFTNEDVIGNQTPFYFDASVKDIYLCLKKGITLCIIPKKLFMFPVKLVEYLNVNRITAILWATSAITLLSNSQIFKKVLPEHLNKVFFAGEAMFAKHLNGWRKYLPEAEYINLYGPTEATVDCTYYIVNREFGDEEVIPIGNACRNMEVILLDEDRRPVDGNRPGELCVRGTGVALGYINSPELSAEVFIQNPLNTAYRDILYCTGDIVRYNECGELVFLSRKDGQVKHMGNRIELGEIEAAVNGVNQVQACVCFYDHEAAKIILFYTGSVDKTELVIKLSQRLPKYMLPNVIEQFEAFPYNANGKIDRRKLSEKYANEKN